MTKDRDRDRDRDREDGRHHPSDSHDGGAAPPRRSISVPIMAYNHPRHDDRQRAKRGLSISREMTKTKDMQWGKERETFKLERLSYLLLPKGTGTFIHCE